MTKISVRDRQNTNLKIEVVNGERTESIVNGFSRTLSVLPGTDGVPETFIDRYGGKDVGAAADYFIATWDYRERWYAEGELTWECTDARISGVFLKKDGTRGERSAGQRWYRPDNKDTLPQWVATLLAKYAPDGEENPFAIEIPQGQTNDPVAAEIKAADDALAKTEEVIPMG